MDLGSLWKRLLQAMQRRYGHDEVEIWLHSARLTRLDGNLLVLEVNNTYYADWIRENYLEALQQEATSALGVPVQLDFTYREEPTQEVSREASFAVETEAPRDRGLGVNPQQTFDNFVIGECNKFAHAAAGAVAEFPATNYNPLYIYGSTGLGKTHLIHSIGNDILRRHHGSRVVYVTAEDFMNEMINCLRYKRMEDFRAKYRKRATCLLVDDIQFLSGKDRTQEEFFHTFNALQSQGRQIILTSDVTPREIDKLEPRLRTRFEGGLLADMQAPDKETLLAILWQKADGQALSIPPALADAIANSVAGNIRELEGVLNRLAALKSFYNEPLTLEFARKKLPNIFSPEPASVSVPAIIEAVARYHTVHTADIVGKRRTRTLTRPRHIAMYLARKHTGLSYPELGREFGGRDHSTIQHGCRKVAGELRDDADLATKVRLIEHALKVR